jgi:hypothetical protein
MCKTLNRRQWRLSLLSILLENHLFNKTNLSVSLSNGCVDFQVKIINGVGQVFYKNELYAETDGRKYVVVNGEQYNINRRVKSVRRDEVRDSTNQLLYEIERDFQPDNKNCFLNNYTKVTSELGEFLIEYKQWKIFGPIKVICFFDKEIQTKDILINLLIAWLRIEYESHDQHY